MYVQKLTREMENIKYKNVPKDENYNVWDKKKNTLDGSIRSEKTGEFEEKAIETQKWNIQKKT